VNGLGWDPDQIDHLLTPAQPPASRRSDSGGWASGGDLSEVRMRVSEQTWRLLSEATKNYGNTTRSGVVRSAMLGLVNAGYDLAGVHEILINPMLKISGVVAARAEKAGQTAAQHVETQWRSTVKYFEDHPPIAGPEGACREVFQIMEAAARCNWKGRAGRRNLSVLEMLLRFALRLRRVEFTISQYELADDTGQLSQPTIHRGIKALERTGWLWRKHNRQGYGDTIHLRIPSTESFNTVDHLNDLNDSLAGTILHTSVHAAFRRGGLPPSCPVILAALDTDRGRLPKEIVSVTGLSRNTVDRNLKVMTEPGLVEQLADGSWARIATPDLDQVAEAAGTAQAARLQRSRNARRRENYRKAFGWSETVTDPETGHKRCVVTITDAQVPVLVRAIVDLVEAKGSWCGTASDLLSLFDRAPSQRWPADPEDLAERLGRVHPWFADRGVEVVLESHGGDTWISVAAMDTRPDGCQAGHPAGTVARVKS
jgi:DNA-binding MarR family transcriptional regulator